MRTQALCLALAIVLLCADAAAQFVQQGGKLVGTGAVGNNSYQGRSVSLSADGSTAIVGGAGDRMGVGAAWVFIRNASGVGGQAVDIPDHFILHQNYPNPFNPSVTIVYELPKSAIVNLNVYDVLGRQVSVLVNEKKDAGVHNVKFDGSGLASGVYLYRLQANGFTQTPQIAFTEVTAL